MLKIETRPLTEDERKLIARAGRPARMGCASRFALYGMFLVFIPAIFGGLIGYILKGLTVPEGWAYGIGFLIVFPVSIYLLAAIVLDERRAKSQSRATAEDALAKNEALDVEIDPIQRAWEFSEMGDFGPGHLLKGSETHFIFFCTDNLSEFWPDDEIYLDDGCPFPGSKLSFTYLPVVDFILDVKLEGSPTTLETYSIPYDWPGEGRFAKVSILTRSQVEPLLSKARTLAGN